MEAVTSPDFQHVLLSSQAVVCLHAATVRVHVQIIYSLKEGWDIWNWKDNKRSTFSCRWFCGSCKFILTYDEELWRPQRLQCLWFASVFPDKNKKETFYTFAFFSPLQPTILCHGPNHFMRLCSKKKPTWKFDRAPRSLQFFQQLDLTKVKPLPHHKQTTQEFVWKRTENTPLLLGPL